MSFPKTKTSSDKRGYGREHQQARKAALPHFLGTRCPGLPGQPCTNVIGPDAHFDHSTVPASHGGKADRFLCPDCNRRDGAAKGGKARARRGRPRPRRLSNIRPLDL